MITLMELIDATTWLEPQDHIRITLWDKARAYEEDEFKNIKLTVCNLAKYGNYYVSDIDIESDNCLHCLIWEG